MAVKRKKIVKAAPAPEQVVAVKKPRPLSGAFAPPAQPSVPATPYVGPAHTFVAFSDLHFSEKTKERALRTLERVGVMAETHNATIVFCGDWWDRRGVLDVRHVDAIQNVIAKWPRAVIIPGNHDQVSVDGAIHGARIFEGYAHIQVATQPIYWTAERTAFLPWREDPAEQAALISNLEGSGWTVFGHFEIEGARTNHHHIAPGRVTTALIESKARACYAGHYHKRQKLGACSWYVGSPFEQTFGEMDQPHGAAIIDLGTAEPTWSDFTDFPKHVRVDVHAAAASGVMPEIRAQDIVEVIAPKETLAREDIRTWITSIPAADVRMCIVEQEAQGEKAPRFALTLDEALGQYVETLFAEADKNGADIVDGMSPDALLELGRSLLAQVPGTRDGAKLGSKVSIGEVTARDFCALRGEVAINLRDRGPLLVCGPIGLGKTALLDSVTWCLFGSTTPRKAGATTASLRADEVIHDDADSTMVRVELIAHRADGPLHVEVTRTKARGKGASVSVKGLGAQPGIDQKDGDALIRYVLGLDFGLWRACNSLGQGAVGNFVTGADKARKELLSGAYGLDVCPLAQKAAKDRAKVLEYQVDKARIDLASAQRVRETLGESSYETQIAEWDVQHAHTVASHMQTLTEAQGKIVECDQHLAAEGGWLASKAQFEAHVSTLTQQLATTTAGAKAAELQKAIGAVQAERSMIERDISRARTEVEQLVAGMAGQQSGPCPTCQQQWPRHSVEAHVGQIEQRVAGLQRSLVTLAHREENLANDASNAGASAERVRAVYQSEIESAREKLGTVAQALQQFAVIKANKINAQRALAGAQVEVQRLRAMLNPWALKAQEHAAQLARLDEEIARARTVLDADGPKVAALRFWAEAFGPGGVPQVVLRTAMFELETYANAVLSRIVGGRLAVSLVMTDDDLDITFRKFYRSAATWRERRYEQLSGGERRCVELAFSPFGLSELISAKTGARVPVLFIDEMTTHLGDEEKREIAQYLHSLDRETIVIVDHDRAIQAEFEQIYDLDLDENYRTRLTRRTK